MLEAYAKDHGYENIRHYTDDGYSGGSFERPGWKKMIEDIESALISTVIAKDMSRIDRNYLEVGYYTEIFFGQHNIHFIAVANNVDSDNQGSSEFAPFLNIMNEWYLKDCYNKIKASKRSLGNSGVHLSSQPVYGYLKDPTDKHKWIVDDEAAEVVRLIYQLCIEGNGTAQIARILSERKIETPSYHAAKRGEGRFRHNIEALDPYNWNASTVKNILSRPEYVGYTINFKTTSKSYKEHKNLINSPDKWEIFEGTQDPIIDQYTHQLVQKLTATPRRKDTFGESNPLTGLVFCADCGAKMYNHRARGLVNRHGRKLPPFDTYDCSAYKLSTKSNSEQKCISHYISTKALREVVLYTIRCACAFAIKDKDAFIQKVRHETETRKANMAEDGKKKYEADKRRMQELDKVYKKLYESFALGIVPEDKFRMLADSYESEQEKLQADIQAYEAVMAERKGTDDDIDHFYDLVERYTSFEELTPQMLNEFVDKILVHRAEKIDGRRTQKVEVYLNFIGNIDFPKIEEPKDPEQEKIDQYWRDRYQRNKNRELARRKVVLAAANEKIDAELKAKRERKIQEYKEEIEAVGIENLSIIPEALRTSTQSDNRSAQTL